MDWDEVDLDFEPNLSKEELELNAPASLVDIMDNLGLDHGEGAPTPGQRTILPLVWVWP
jgi:hypothetical protein